MGGYTTLGVWEDILPWVYKRVYQPGCISGYTNQGVYAGYTYHGVYAGYTTLGTPASHPGCTCRTAARCSTDGHAALTPSVTER